MIPWHSTVTGFIKLLVLLCVFGETQAEVLAAPPPALSLQAMASAPAGSAARIGTDALSYPGTEAPQLSLISPLDADKLVTTRIDLRGQNASLKAPAQAAQIASKRIALAASAAPIPPSVAELARALKYDPVLIYEFVHNNIEYFPVWGMLKGSVGALVDGRGTSFDIAQLTADLINADPSHAATATLVRGTINVAASDASSWIALNGMNVCPLAYTFSNGYIPTSYNVSGYPDCRGAGASVTLGHVWVKVTIGSTSYEIDPSFKTHTAVAASANLATITGYVRSSYLASICPSCNTDPKVVPALNRANILNPAQTQSLPTFANNLLQYMRSNNIHDLKQVIGGYTLDQSYVSSLPTLPYTVVSRTADPFTIDGTWKAALLVNFNGISQLFSSDAIYGHRLSITFNASNYPQLNLDGSVVQTGTTAVPLGSYATVTTSVCLPISGVNCSDASVDGSGKALWCSNPPPIKCVQSSILSGGTFVISNSWGPMGDNMVMRHRIASIQQMAAGTSPTAEPYLGEVLATLGASWSEQYDRYIDLSEDGMRNGGYAYFHVGIAGHGGTNGGRYVDLPANVVFPGMNTQLNGDGSYTASQNLANFMDVVEHSSVLESTSVAQLAGVAAVSTAKLIDIGIASTSSSNVYDLRSPADYATYSSQLIGYSTPVLTSVQSFLSAASGNRVVLPQRGNLSDPSITTSPKWQGAGYYALTGATIPTVSALINGGYAGGYAAIPWTAAATDNGAVDDGEIVVTAQTRNVTVAPTPSGACGGWLGCFVSAAINKVGDLFQAGRKKLADPVDQASGSFINATDDIATGEIPLIRQVSLSRSYVSSDVAPSPIFGQGWRGNIEITSDSGSDGIRATGGDDAWDAAEILAEKYVSRDLMSDPSLPVLNIAVASIGHRWIGDLLVNNLVAVNAGGSAFQFQRVADGSYNPSQGTTARLNGTPANWVVIGSDGTRMLFGAPDSTGIARVGTIQQPTGITTTFTYSGSQLTQVSNNLGRILNLSWTGGHVTSISDAPLAGGSARTVTYSYSGNLLQQVTDVRGGRTLYCYDGSGRMTAYYLPTQGSGTSCSASGANITNSYDSLGRVQQQTDGAGHVTDLYLAGTRAEWVTHPGSGVADIRSIHYLDAYGDTVRGVNPRTGLPTSYTYDALSRLVRTTYPEGNAVEISYDIRSNPIRTCSIPKVAGAYPACDTSGTSSQIWTSTAYNEGTTIWDCGNKNSCNKPASTIDALGNVTSYSYNSDGTLASATEPTPSGYAGAPKTTYTYTPTASLSGNVNLLTSAQLTSTAGSTPSITTSYGYDTAANGLTLRTATLDPSGLNYATSYGYDGYGNRTTVKGPRTDVDDTVTTAFDAGRNPTTIAGPNPGSGPPVTQLTNDGNNRVTSIAVKLGANWMVSCTTYSVSGQVSASYGAWKTSSPTDCSFSGNTAVPYINYTYDGADRLIATTQALPTGDRMTQVSLLPDDLAGSVTRAAGTSVAATETTAYSNNGLPISVTDARGNITGMGYDGFDRLVLMQYPLATGGGPSSTDVVAFAYDKRSAVTARSIRGTSDVSASCTQCIAFAYDELGRLKQKTVPTIAANAGVVPNVAAVTGYGVFYHYDLIGRLDSQGYSAGSPELTFAYDNASRLTTAAQYGRTVGYTYGPPSQGLARTLTWPGSAGTMLTCTDALGRVTQIKEAADCTTTTGRLVLYGYDDLSRRTSITRANGAGTSLSYQDTGAFDTLAHVIGGGGSVTSTFGYNRALQVTSRTTDNDLYAWTNHYNIARSYTPNGLDQYGQILGDAMAWDARGNLAAYRGVSYGYDGENRLAAAAMAAGTATTGYDPAGRLRQIGAATTSQLLYDGDAPIAEYDAASGAILTRFVPGPGTDETIAAYDAGGIKSWYHADAQGSVIATSDASGNVSVINQYGPFGEPGLVYQGRNQGRIGYTGQIALPELAPYGGPSQPLYSFKARIYAPKLGRFLQTDPIGAADDRNLYAYVANDPLNRIDPTGLAAEKVGNIVAGTARSVGRDLADLARGIVRGDVGYVLGGLPPVIFPEATIAEETTTLYRAVGPAELQDIQATGAFRTIPGSAEGKYFTTSPNAASSYAQQAVSGFKDPPYTIVQTKVPNSVISDLPLTQVDRGGIPAYVIPSERLPGLQPQTLNTSPLPGGR